MVSSSQFKNKLSRNTSEPAEPRKRGEAILLLSTTMIKVLIRMNKKVTSCEEEVGTEAHFRAPLRISSPKM